MEGSLYSFSILTPVSVGLGDLKLPECHESQNGSEHLHDYPQPL
jgi:hypothetical protein